MKTETLKLFDRPDVAPQKVETDACAACELARLVSVHTGEVFFFEAEDGSIRRVENVSTYLFPCAFACREVTAEQARAEIAEAHK